MSILQEYKEIEKLLGKATCDKLEQYLILTGQDWSIVYNKAEWEKFKAWERGV